MALAEHLVGRAEELGSLDNLLAQLDGGRSAALELTGEPGIGKTRLLAELAARADARGHTVLSGCATELERDLPFWVFVDALDEYVHGLDPRRLQSLDEDVRAELATVFPSLAALTDGGRVAIQHERYRSHRAVRVLLERLAPDQPVVLMLDDLHWADPASVELLGALLHRPPVAPVLLALAVRPRHMGERLSTAFDRAHRAGTLERIELGPLTRQQAREFVDEGRDTALTDLYEETGGNPFYLEQLVRSAERSGSDATTGREISIGGVDVPPLVATALAAELALLPEHARLVLEGAAVAGDPFDPELAAAAAGVPEAAVLNALDELLRLALIHTTDVPRRFRFRHPLIRRTVYELSAGGWRLGAHERCAEALTTRGAPASARAHHVELSARQGDAAAIACLREAAETAAQRAPASAAGWLGGALRLLPDAAPNEERVELLLARSGALAAVGRFGDGHEALLEAMEIVPDDAEAMRVHLTVACAGVEHLLGRQKDARAHLETALAELRAADSPHAVELMIELTVDSLYSGDYDDMRRWGARAVDAARALGDRALLAAALGVRAWAAALFGAPVEAQAQCDEAADLIDAMTDDEVGRRLDGLAHLAGAELYLDRFAAGGGHAERALSIGRATGQGDLFPLVVAVLGSCLWVQGRPTESGEIFDGAVEAARLVGNVHGLAWHLFNRSFAAFAAGDIKLALTTAEESFELAKNLDEGPVSAHAAVALAYALLETGRADRSAELLVTKAGGDELRLIGGGWRARYLELLTRCFLAAGRRADGKRAAEAAQACADGVALPMAAAMARLAAAALALDTDQPTSAAEQAIGAAVVLEEAGDIFDAAMARSLAGRALAQAGEQDRAVAELERAAEAFDSFGSVRYRAKAERELRKLGQHIHRPTRRGPDNGDAMATLTARELEVARLVVERKTNPEIAGELFVSLKTVESHLRNIFRKLGVASRVELARAVEQSDRVGLTT